MGKAQQNVNTWQTWHSSRTYNPGHSQLDPWMRDVLLNLQLCLNSLAKQIDDNTDRLDRLEQWAARQR